MSKHRVVVEWDREGATFVDNRYSRVHQWRFDGGATIAASSSPDVVKPPFSNPANVDPEEAYVAALSSCHMLWFLNLAASAGYVVDSYRDEAVGSFERGVDGKYWIPRVELNPTIEFSGAKVPDAAAVERLHHAAHDECFLARSVKTDIVTAGQWRHSSLTAGASQSPTTSTGRCC